MNNNTRHNKTPYELVHDKKPDLTFLRVFGALCYPTNDSEDLGKFQAKADIGIFVGYAPSRKGYRIYNKRTRRLMEIIHVTFDEMHQSMAPVHMSSGPAPFIMTPGQLKSGLAPTDKELEMLFQPMFDEHLEQSRVNEPVPSATEINAQVVPPGTSLSTTIAQDAPSTSASSSTSDIHLPVQHQEIAEEPIQEDTPIIHDVLPPSHNLVTGDPGSAQSSSGNVNAAEPNQVNYPPDHLRRWTKDHPLDNIVGNPSRPVSTRKQLASDALWCCFHTELSRVEPKNFKMAVIEDCWFQAMQDEIHEFDRLEVWELVPRPIYVMVIALKWIYKVKLDEYGDASDVLKLKLWLGAKGYRQEGRHDFEESFVQLHDYRPSSPEGFEDQENPTHVYRLKKALYGLKQAPRACRPDLVFAVCMCARYQAKPTKKHFEAIKRVFRYLKGTINMGLWYLKDNAMSTKRFCRGGHADVKIQDERLNTSPCLDVVLKSFGCDSQLQRYDLTSIKFLCTMITRVLLLFAVTTSSTLDQNTSTYGTISSESKEWLNSTSWKRIINLQTFSPKHYQENGNGVLRGDVGIEVSTIVNDGFVCLKGGWTFEKGLVWGVVERWGGWCIGKVYYGNPRIFLTQSKSQSQYEGPKEESFLSLIPYGRFSKCYIYYLASKQQTPIDCPGFCCSSILDDDFYIRTNLKFGPKGESGLKCLEGNSRSLITEAIQHPVLSQYLEMVVCEIPKKYPLKSKCESATCNKHALTQKDHNHYSSSKTHPSQTPARQKKPYKQLASHRKLEKESLLSNLLLKMIDSSPSVCSSEEGV
ncbi:putative ribonuclease H-like domain-containing protein [Tanacetum coccineum]